MQLGTNARALPEKQGKPLVNAKFPTLNTFIRNPVMNLKKLALLTTLLGSFSSFNAQAAAIDPIYILSTGYCNVYEVYLTDDGHLFGNEIGCSAEGTLVGGYYAGGVKVSFAIPSSTGGIAILVYDLAANTRTRGFIAADGKSMAARTSNGFTYQLNKPSGTFVSKLPNELDHKAP